MSAPSEPEQTELKAMRERMAVYIFSYNRAQLLDHSIDTTLQCLVNFDCIVVDDDSNDPATVGVLKKWAHRVTILPVQKSKGENKTGGLYPNMSLALNHALHAGYDYALFTQDDMQFIRPFQSRDIELIETYFTAHPNAIQLLLHFVKRPQSDSPITDLWALDDSGTVYLRTERNRHDKGNFCAGGIFDVARTKAALGHFRTSEAENSQIVRAKGIYYGFSRVPLITFMPAPISYRGKKRSLEHRLYEWLGGAGFHPLDLMTPEEIDWFWQRERKTPPLAEDVLHCPTAPAPDNWAAGGGDYLVVARGGWRKSIYDLIAGAKVLVKRVIQ